MLQNRVDDTTDYWSVDTIACAWEIEIVNVPSVEALPIDTSHCEDAALPEDIYFHQSPLSENGAIPSPAGYWSLTPEPLSGPLQELPLPGLSLDCRTRVKCAGLNSLQAELISYFGRELQRL
ncbi:hypothetical protein OBBRIDRAFT_791792 [Obba rivulosa]|uniref:Uncharacterized protein n=1 Tax=Obba rivulosa TaxID=1052685 RepID=A0A8E2DKW4_9APHY|nr:hypothetical protein OBBRIDRAFT_791792 [Obba rivulosa]